MTPNHTSAPVKEATDTNTVTQTFPVTGMSCAACAASVDSMLQNQPGVAEAAVNFASHTAKVSYNPAVTNPAALQKTIRSIGYDLLVEESESTTEALEERKEAKYRELKVKTFGAVMLAFPVALIGMFFHGMPFGNWIMMAFTLPIVFVFGRHFFVNAWKQLKHRQASMDTLVALSTGIAFLFSAFNTIYPEFFASRGLTPHVYYEAAAFTIDFWVPGSDVGCQGFFMLNRSGDLIENSIHNYFGGGDCDGSVALSPNEDFILTCRKILHSDGSTVKIDNDKFWQVGVKLINKNAILLVQEHNDTTNKSNASIIDKSGKTLVRFPFNGYYNVLGYTIPMIYNKYTKSFYLLDEEFKNLRIINKDYPAKTYTVEFNKMKKFSGGKRASEISFDLNTETTNNTFYIDTLTKIIRHQKL